MTYILLFFVMYANGPSTSVRVGFDSQATCVAAAKDTQAQLKTSYPDARIDWACVKQ